MSRATNSYTAAGAFPAKLLKRAAKAMNGKGIAPLHVQISPTNKCNLHCPWCSCENRERGDEMDWDTARWMLAKFHSMGTESITITGGGEPTLWPYLPELLRMCHQAFGIQTGLVTNGTTLSKGLEHLDTLRWCRVSFSDTREFDTAFAEGVIDAVQRAPNVDWAFSYVITANPDWRKLAKVVALANMLRFTHVRVVPDLINLEDVPGPDLIRLKLTSLVKDDSRVIYQERHEFEPGAERCLVSLLKPMVAADGNVYPCCGVQYAQGENSLDFTPSMRMGSDIGKIWDAQEGFDGSKCVTCYYGNYNAVLAQMVDPLDHEEFV